MLQRLILIAPLLVCGFASDRAAAQDAIGMVSRIQGNASAMRGGTTRALALNASVFRDEIVSTAETTRLEVTFSDNTRLTLGERATLTLDAYVFDPAGGNGTIKFGLVGAFRFESGRDAGEPSPRKQKGSETTPQVRRALAYWLAGPMTSSAIRVARPLA